MSAEDLAGSRCMAPSGDQTMSRPRCDGRVAGRGLLPPPTTPRNANGGSSAGTRSCRSATHPASRGALRGVRRHWMPRSRRSTAPGPSRLRAWRIWPRHAGSAARWRCRSLADGDDTSTPLACRQPRSRARVLRQDGEQRGQQVRLAAGRGRRWSARSAFVRRGTRRRKVPPDLAISLRIFRACGKPCDCHGFFPQKTATWARS